MVIVTFGDSADHVVVGNNNGRVRVRKCRSCWKRVIRMVVFVCVCMEMDVGVVAKQAASKGNRVNKNTKVNPSS